jgi:hypothetical protein
MPAGFGGILRRRKIRKSLLVFFHAIEKLGVLATAHPATHFFSFPSKTAPR